MVCHPVLLTSVGDLWRRWRRHRSPFTQRSILQLTSAMIPTVEAMLARWETAARDGTVLAINREMAYTRMVVVGTMRLYPPVWTFPRAAIADDVSGGYHIRDGALPLDVSDSIRTADPRTRCVRGLALQHRRIEARIHTPHIRRRIVTRLL
jgi:cytochrome P450